MTGIGLFLLRVITASELGRSGYELLYESAAGLKLGLSLAHGSGVLLSLLGIAMIIGFAVSISAVVAFVVLCVSFIWLKLPLNAPTATAFGLSIVLVLLGPGAYSVDSLLFGWRQIEITQPKK
jgi:uncharacterized membrane protein YphA (DoxX/SURF4 family)